MDSAPDPANPPKPITPGPNFSAHIVEDCYELSPLQQGMLFHALYAEHCGVDVEQIQIDLDEPLNIPAFEQAWQQVVKCHGVLRTSFHWDGLKEPLQQVHAGIKVSIEQHDWRDRSPAEDAERMEAYLRSDRQRGFDLREAPLIRLALFRFGDAAFRLVWTFHHILLDGRSFPIILKGVFAIYEAICRGETLELPQPRPYRDYIEWLKQQDLSGAEEFWRNKLSGFSAPTPLLPARDAAEPPATEEYAEEDLEFSEAFTAALADFAQRENLTLNTLIQGAWALLLSKYTGEEDIVFGAIKTLRRSSLDGAESMVGLFLNAIPVRVRVPANMTARVWLNQLRDEWLSLRPFEHTPLAEIKECSDVPGGASLFDSLIVFDHQRFDAVLRAEGGAWAGRRFRLLERTNYRITLDVYGGPQIFLKIQWDTKQFGAPAIRRMLGHLRTLLESIRGDPAQRLGDLSLLTLPERHQLLTEWNDTRTEYAADSCLHELIEAQVERTPENVALVYEDQSWSYRELNARANQLARRLCSLGVGPESLVGLCVERSLEMVLGVLGILKAGGAYVPLDPAYPPDRLAFMLEDSQAPLLLTQEHLLASLPTHGARVVCLDRDWPSIATEEVANIHGRATSRNLAYVIYTSGSTGRPKAAQLEHRGLCNLAETQARTCSVGPESRILQFCSLSFDPSIFDIAVALCSGARLCLAPQSSLAPGPAMAQLLRDQAISMMTLPPSILAPLADEPLPSLRTIVVGAEPCSLDVLHRWSKGRHFFNIYGVTEATVFSTIAECRDNGRRPHIGRAIANNQVYLLDRSLHPVPIGIPGELYIGGVGLARGYLHRPELTAEKFIPNPFSNEPGARLYKTGDMARYLEDGNIEFLGRFDHQVKIRGYRIELEEIEALLENCSAVREGVVVVREDIPGDRRLVAYIVPRQPSVSAAELRSVLAQNLPDYMVPSAFVFLGGLPLSPNGKVNRRALPKPALAADHAAREFAPPRDDLEKRLATIWTQALGVESIGIHDNFFQLGGDSILSIQVVGRANQAGIRLTPRQIFQHPTIAELALVANLGPSPETKLAPAAVPVAKLQPQQLAQAQRIVPDLIDAYPLSPMQQGMLFHSLREQGSGVYIVQLSCLLQGDLDVSAFERAWRRVAAQHAVLRTAFLWEGFDEPVQVVRPEVHLLLAQHDWSGRSDAEQRQRLETFLRNDRKEGFVLAQAPLVRLALIRLDTRTHRFVLSFHNLLLDGWSVLKDALTYYQAYCEGRDTELESVTPYREYIAWLGQQDLAGAEAWWKKELSGFTTPTRFRLPQPTAGVSTREASGAPYAEQELLLPERTTEALRSFARQYGLTLNTIVQGAWGLLLSRYSGEEDVVFGITLSGRSPALAGIDSIVGLCINTLPARIKAPARASLLEWLRELQAHQAELRQYEFTPLVEVQRWSGVSPGQSLFDSILVFQNYSLDPSLWDCSGLSITDVRVFEQTNYPLTLAAVPGARLSLTIGYHCSRFESAAVTRMLGHLQTLLESMVANPQQELAKLSLVTSAERQLLAQSKQTYAEHPRHRCIHHLVETQVERAPEAPAVSFARTQLTYRQLNERANQLGNFLLKLGVGPEVSVGICIERSPEMLVAILGVLKAGGAYVPLDPSYPRERLTFMLQDCQAPVLLTKQQHAANFPEASARLVCLDGDCESISAENARECAGEAGADNLAYIIYTSGSTGRPKGVLVNHANLVHSTSARISYYQKPVGSFLLLSPSAFDSSLAGIFWTLATGGTLILPPLGLERDPLELAHLIARKRITHLLSLPSLYDLLLAEAAQQDLLGSLRCVVVAGERCPPELIARHKELLPNSAIFNEYGPTEATVWSTVQNGESVAANALVPIGRPIAKTQIHLLDARLEPVPIGLPGELYIGGAGVARGYLNEPELTAEKFIPDPFSEQPSARLYKTGDLARYRDDYAIEFLGRLDHQVKIRGFRIELEEIETVLASHRCVRQAAVVARDDGSGNQRLLAYFVSDESSPNSAQLREFLASKLPDYMVPAGFVPLEALPLSPNGKVDRQALLALEPDFRKASPKLAAPRDDLEFALQQIWEKMLGVRPVRITDNFFVLGGHSLLAVRLVSQVHKVLGRSLALSSFFQAPTIVQMAATLRGEPGLSPRPCVPIQPFGPRPAFFVAGSDPAYVRLAEHLGSGQPFYRLDVYALQEQRLVEGYELYSQVEALAAAFVKEIESVQPTGPYFLGGGCEGAIVSFEIARQLQARGASVAMLAIWQTPPAENWDWLLYTFARMRRAARFLVHHARELATFGIRKTTGGRLAKPNQDLLDALRLEHITVSTVRAVRSYVSRSFQGRITLFRAQKQSRRYPTRAEDWERLAVGGLEVHVIPGNHVSYLGEYLPDFAARLKTCLNRANAMADKLP